MPDTDTQDESYFRQGHFAAQAEEVKLYLKSYSDVDIYKGLFQDTRFNIENGRFSLVHLDVDIYQSAIECLEFFFHRVVQGGVILSHDYTTSKGVRKAFDEFFKDKAEGIIELAGTQYCMVWKR